MYQDKENKNPSRFNSASNHISRAPRGPEDENNGFARRNPIGTGNPVTGFIPKPLRGGQSNQLTQPRIEKKFAPKFDKKSFTAFVPGERKHSRNTNRNDRNGNERDQAKMTGQAETKKHFDTTPDQNYHKKKFFKLIKENVEGKKVSEKEAKSKGAKSSKSTDFMLLNKIDCKNNQLIFTKMTFLEKPNQQTTSTTNSEEDKNGEFDIEKFSGKLSKKKKKKDKDSKKTRKTIKSFPDYTLCLSEERLVWKNSINYDKYVSYKNKTDNKCPTKIEKLIFQLFDVCQKNWNEILMVEYDQFDDQSDETENLNNFTFTPKNINFTSISCEFLINFKEIFKPKLDKDFEKNFECYVELPESEVEGELADSNSEANACKVEPEKEKKTTASPPVDINSSDESDDFGDWTSSDENVSGAMYERTQSKNEEEKEKVDKDTRENRVYLSKNYPKTIGIFKNSYLQTDFRINFWKHLKNKSDEFQTNALINKKLNKSVKPELKKFDEIKNCDTEIQVGMRDVLGDMKLDFGARQKANDELKEDFNFDFLLNEIDELQKINDVPATHFYGQEMDD